MGAQCIVGDGEGLAEPKLPVTRELIVVVGKREGKKEGVGVTEGVL